MFKIIPFMFNTDTSIAGGNAGEGAPTLVTGGTNAGSATIGDTSSNSAGATSDTPATAAVDFSYDSWDGDDTKLPEQYKPAHNYYNTQFTKKQQEAEAKYKKDLETALDKAAQAEADKVEQSELIKRLEANYNTLLIEGRHPEYEDIKSKYDALHPKYSELETKYKDAESRANGIQKAYEAMDNARINQEYAKWKDANKDVFTPERKPIMKELMEKNPKLDIDDAVRIVRLDSKQREAVTALLAKGVPAAVALELSATKPKTDINPVVAAHSARMTVKDTAGGEPPPKESKIVDIQSRIKDAAARNYRA